MSPPENSKKKFVKTLNSDFEEIEHLYFPGKIGIVHFSSETKRSKLNHHDFAEFLGQIQILFRETNKRAKFERLLFSWNFSRETKRSKLKVSDFVEFFWRDNRSKIES